MARWGRQRTAPVIFSGSDGVVLLLPVTTRGVLTFALFFERLVVGHFAGGVLYRPLDALTRRRGFFGHRTLIVTGSVRVVRTVEILFGHSVPPMTAISATLLPGRRPHPYRLM